MKTDKKKLLPNVGSRMETKAMRNAIKAMRDADSLETFFIAMHAMLITPEYKNFKVTKFHTKTGKPKSGKYVVDKASMPIHYYFAKDSIIDKMKLAPDVREFLIENVPKRGTFFVARCIGRYLNRIQTGCCVERPAQHFLRNSIGRNCCTFTISFWRYTMIAMLILIHLNVDARERALQKDDFTGAKVFIGFTGVNRIQAEDFKPESGSVRGAMFTSKEEFKQALNGVDAYCRKANQENGYNLCTSGFKLEMFSAATWSAAEDILEMNED